MTKYPQLHLNNQLCFALYSASHQISKLYHPYLKGIGLTYPQYIVMMVLWENREEGGKEILVTEVAEKVLLDTGTLSPLLKRMERAGLIERNRSLQDERRVEVSLTEKGWMLREKAKTIPEDLFGKLELPLEDLILLKDSVETIREKASQKL